MLALVCRLMPPSWNGCSSARADLVGDVERALGVADVGDEQGELVAAEAGDGVGAAQHLLEAPAHLDQQAVALVVAEGVVDVLELVEVHDQQPDRVPDCSEPSSAARSRSLSSVRLGRPVSPSCRAWRRRTSAAIVRSVTSWSDRPTASPGSGKAWAE